MTDHSSGALKTELPLVGIDLDLRWSKQFLICFSFQNCTLQSEDAGNGDSYWVSFEEKSFCKGNAFKVYSGKMNGRGKKSGDRCVVKVFRKCMGTKVRA